MNLRRAADDEFDPEMWATTYIKNKTPIGGSKHGDKILYDEQKFRNFKVVTLKELHWGKYIGEVEADERRDIKRRRDIKLGDMNGREETYRSVIQPNSLHTDMNDNDQLCIILGAFQEMVSRSTFFPAKHSTKPPEDHQINSQQLKRPQ